MSVVPSHDCLLLKDTAGQLCLLFRGSPSSGRSFRSIHVIPRIDTVLILVGLPTQRFLIFTCRTLHPPVRCDRPGDPSACTTGRYL
jgi:hypothetical protein